jgi:glucokinase
MYLGIDVGGTKTLLAVFDSSGSIIKEEKFATPVLYQDFLGELKKYTGQFEEYHLIACCIALPGIIDRTNGVGMEFGRLQWHNVPIKKDLESLLAHIPIYVENDTNLAGLSEALNHTKYKKVVYLTISTGIGDAYIVNGKIDPDTADSEIGNMIVEHGGKLQKWQDIASGQTIKDKYGKLARDIDDPKIWDEYVDGLVVGFEATLSAYQPQLVIIGGGVGAYFEKFGDLLIEKLEKLNNKMVQVPPIIKAKRPEEAVIYGCYDFIIQHQ